MQLCQAWFDELPYTLMIRWPQCR